MNQIHRVYIQDSLCGDYVEFYLELTPFEVAGLQELLDALHQRYPREIVSFSIKLWHPQDPSRLRKWLKEKREYLESQSGK